MNFDKFRFYHCVPDTLGDFICIRIKTSNFQRLPNSRIIVIKKTWPKFLDKLYLSWQLSPMDVYIEHSRVS